MKFAPKLLMVVVASLLFVTLLGEVPGLRAQEDIFNDVCVQEPESPVCKEATATTGSSEDNPISGTIQDAANIVAIITGIVAVVMIIISGLVFITASGNQERTAQARRVLTYSVIGLAVVGAAWTIVTFVTNNLIKT